ncbi:MAG TPA: molybdopterin cofactor-binding domain-containing protein, partial [Gemmatimonadales bacterium]|nr:molybdopterin cofactor-binding domain-containing protein [Gemmatimonadales bacterium]
MRAAGLHNLIAMVRGLDVDAVEGAAEPPYALANMRVEYVRQEPPGIPTAFWRGVGTTHSIFVVESFIDELAVAAKQDPFEYRRALLDKSPRAKAVLELAAERAGWERPLPPRSGQGISLLHAFGETYIAQVAEVSVTNEGDVRVQRVVCAIDCGSIVNPDTVKAQMESGIIFGITAALFGEITIKDGRVEQGNFDDYRVLRINETPLIEVHLVRSMEAPGGVGEPGTSALRSPTRSSRRRESGSGSCRSTAPNSNRPSPWQAAQAGQLKVAYTRDPRRRLHPLAGVRVACAS